LSRKKTEKIAPAAASGNPDTETTGLVVGALLLILSSFLLFGNLGHYALWDDETYTALGAKGVLKTGDTSAVIDHNIVAFRGGIMLKKLRDRFSPPLPTYLAAASFSLLGVNSFAARFPFALCGLASLLLIVTWLRRAKAPPLIWHLTAIAILGNVSLFLYFRQSRYYALVILCSIALGYLYCNWRDTRLQTVGFALVSVCLFASNYIAYFEVYTALTVDYLFWGRRSIKLRPRAWLLLLGIQAVANIAITMIWNPFSTHHGGALFTNNPAQRVTLFFWNLRDLNACEFGVAALLTAAPLLYFKHRNLSIIRGCIAILVCIAATCMVSPQPVAKTSVADIRYILPVIPLCILVEVLTLQGLPGQFRWAAIALAILAFHTNFFNGGLFQKGGIHSSSISFVKELISPPGDPYSATVHWIDQNVSEGQSIWVLPDYSTYPLMFHSPKAVYAWQLKWPPEEQFKDLPRIHFFGQEPPDYIIAFGPVVHALERAMQDWKRPDLYYQKIAVIDYFWQNLYRPELFWRRSIPMTNYNRESDAIYVFKRQSGD
jgi:hypothetical protein